MLTTQEAIDKVRKLLALSQSNNEHEAAAAAARAAAIMESHRLDEAMLLEAERRDDETDDKREGFAINVDMPAERTTKQTVTWYWALAWSVAKANRCMPRYHYGKGGKQVVFAGRPADAAAARYMLDAIANDVDQLAARFVRTGNVRMRTTYHADGTRTTARMSRAAGNSFRLGCVSTIGERLRSTASEAAAARRKSLQAAGDETGLVQLDNALARMGDDATVLRAWLKAQGCTYTKGSGTKISSADAYRAGQAAGRNVRLTGGSAAVGSGARALKRGA
jgi:hypothetical protein